MKTRGGVGSLLWLGTIVALSMATTGSINCSLNATERKAQFSVETMIEMREIYEPAPPSRYGIPPEFAFSPDDSRFLVITRKGDLQRNVNTYELRAYRVDEIKNFLNAQGKGPPTGDAIATMETSGSRLGIEQARWKDNQTVTYLGRNGDDRSAVYEFDTQSQKSKKLIDPGATITHYQLAAGSNYVVFAVIEHDDLTKANQNGYAVGSVYFNDLSARYAKDRSETKAHFYALNTSTGQKQKLDIPADVNSSMWGAMPQLPLISVAPNGKSAIVMAAARYVPEHWEGYAPISDYLTTYQKTFGPAVGGKKGLLQDLANAERKPYWLRQFYLVDLASGKSRPVLDAPAGPAGWSPQIHWSDDGKHLVLGPTFVPPENTTGKERKARLELQSLVRTDLTTGMSEVLFSEEYMLTGRVRELADGSICVQTTSRTVSDAPSTCYQKFEGHWKVAPDVKVSSTFAPLILGIDESMNSRPALTAQDPVTGKKANLGDLNPELERIAVPRMEVFEWKDAFGRPYKGGLVLPPDFVNNKRYPIVLQVNGFSEGEFLIDGGNGMSAAYAARPLAANGIVVLQMKDVSMDAKPIGPSFNWNVDAENQRFMLMVEGAIDALESRSILDRSKVGIIGFSRGGMNTLHAITFSNYKFAAATIAHSVQTTPWGYFALSGLAFPTGMYEFESESNIGGPLWKDGIDLWLQRSPAFHLDKIDAALRIENYTPSVPEQWEVFAQLRRHQKPVELFQINDAQHQIEPPAARFASQQGNVDWYSFWLKGEEDPNPLKADQYSRWRKLRDMRDRAAENEGATEGRK